ncbi:arginase family protein [Photobacterium sp. SDRW27]|uniref:arginase family protein n=1 Tax=Photobacterium obscurum TaxID=2829490 RepID=UPI002243244A|nr:arginase family protein [Photobacterium obscurum]MCW8330260.1 arginase family protein [Photobacterium obscurum]
MVRKFRIVGAPYNHSALVTTKQNTVQALRENDDDAWNGLSDWMDVRNGRWGADIQDLGDVELSGDIQALLERGEKVRALQTYCMALENQLLDVYQSGSVPITIGGDHSIAIATISAALKHYQVNRKEKVAVVWVDAHADCNDSIESNLHGKPLAMLMNRCEHQEWQHDPTVNLKPQDIYYVAIRDLMLNEANLIAKNKITCYDMAAIDELGFRQVLTQLMANLDADYDRIYVSFDYDCLDGSVFRACATPNVGGLSARETLMLVSKLSTSDKFIGIDFVEYLPELDPSRVSKELMVKLIDAVWGYRV